MPRKNKKGTNLLDSYLLRRPKDRESAAIVKEAELMCAPSEHVYRFYQSKSNETFDARKNEIDAEGEKRLLDRHDPFLEIVLATYCFYPETLTTLYTRARVKKGSDALKIACLSNQSVCAQNFICHGKLTEILVPNKKERCQWAQSLSRDELIALFSNPLIDEEFITDFIVEDGYWRSLDDEGLLTALIGLAKNRRLMRDKNDELFKFSFSSVLADNIFNMANHLPVTRDHADVLQHLLETVFSLNPGDYGYDLECAERWFDPLLRIRPRSEQQKRLDYFFWVRFQIYRGYLRDCYDEQHKLENSKYFTSDDPACRYAAYAKLTMSTKEMDEAFQRDRYAAFENMGKNESIFKEKTTREYLRDLCIKHETSDSFFNALANHQWRHPTWFSADEPTDIDTYLRAHLLERGDMLTR